MLFLKLFVILLISFITIFAIFNTENDVIFEKMSNHLKLCNSDDLKIYIKMIKVNKQNLHYHFVISTNIS